MENIIINERQVEFINKFYIVLNETGMSRQEILDTGIITKADLEALCINNAIWGPGGDLGDYRCPYSKPEYAIDEYRKAAIEKIPVELLNSILSNFLTCSYSRSESEIRGISQKDVYEVIYNSFAEYGYKITKTDIWYIINYIANDLNDIGYVAEDDSIEFFLSYNKVDYDKELNRLTVY